MAITFLRTDITDIAFHPLLILGKRYRLIVCLTSALNKTFKHSQFYISLKFLHITLIHVIIMATLYEGGSS